MKEIRKIVEVFNSLATGDKKFALATVINIHGSAYRRPGARMIITDDGRWEGAISGGCLEGDALRKARQVMLSQNPMVVTYDTMSDEGNSLGIGLGCNGIIDILIEPIHVKDPENPVLLLQKFLEKEEKAVMATVYSTEGSTSVKVGERFMRFIEDESTRSSANAEFMEVIQEETEKRKSFDKSFIKSYKLADGEIGVFWEVLNPPVQLVVFGAGNDGIPVVKLAKEIGWKVIVTDDCIAHLAPKRFPAADKIIQAKRTEILNSIPITGHTAAVLMSHNYQYDMAVLAELLKSSAPYIGILGPKKRTEKMLPELREKGVKTEREWLSRIYSPTGLDIGAETPDEIALAIIAEIKAAFAKRSAGFLKHRSGPIHERKDLSHSLVSF